MNENFKKGSVPFPTGPKYVPPTEQYVPFVKEEMERRVKKAIEMGEDPEQARTDYIKALAADKERDEKYERAQKETEEALAMGLNEEEELEKKKADVLASLEKAIDEKQGKNIE